MKLNNKQENERLNEIYKITSVLLNDNSDENTLNYVLKLACSMLGLETGVVCNIKNDEYQILEIFQEGGLKIEKNISINLNDTFCLETIQENQVLAVHDIQNSKYKNNQNYLKFKTAAYIGIPIKFNEKELGTINFSSNNVKEKPFTTEDQDLVTYLGQWVNHFLDRTYFKQILNNKNLELEKLNHKLELNNNRLQEIMRDKNELMQILVHDLKSPLSNIKMLSYLFEEFSESEEHKDLLGIFDNSLTFVIHLIEQMETLNSVENFPLNNYLEEFSLKSFIQEIVKNFDSTAEAKQIKIHFDYLCKKTNIATDMNFLKRVLYNLISNAIKFSSFEKDVKVSVEDYKDTFIITVKDHGPGISKEDQANIFNKFNKLKNKPTNNESSSGLGLYIVKKLLKNLHGKIEIDSELGKGTGFKLTIPHKI
jgi:signal transduction histidine kinase